MKDYVLEPEDEFFRGRLTNASVRRLIYARGIDLELSRTVGIVGTRHPSPYGARVAFELGKYYVRQGYIVVSGLAYGIDEKAHEGALSGGGYTIGVLGHGLGTHYPRATLDLRNRIEQKGLVLSWYSFETLPNKAFFRERNFLIAALSDFVVVVEAPVRSGALITADFALSLGKEVKAVPADIDRVSAQGSNRLIAEGAEPIVSIPEDSGERWRHCTTVEQLVAETGDFIEAGRLIAELQNNGRLKVIGSRILWIN